MKEIFKELMDGMPLSMKIISIFIFLCFILLCIVITHSPGEKQDFEREKPISLLSNL